MAKGRMAKWSKRKITLSGGGGRIKKMERSGAAPGEGEGGEVETDREVPACCSAAEPLL